MWWRPEASLGCGGSSGTVGASQTKPFLGKKQPLLTQKKKIKFLLGHLGREVSLSRYRSAVEDLELNNNVHVFSSAASLLGSRSVGKVCQ